MKRPKRERKDDPLLHPVMPRRTVACDAAIAPFDEIATRMDQKWGADKLITLVSPPTAAKYGSAMHKLRDAIRDNDAELTAARAAVCIRGLQAMDAEAEQAGKRPASAELFLLHFGDREVGILRDPAGYERARAEHPEVELVTEQQVIYALQQMDKRLGDKIRETLK